MINTILKLLYHQGYSPNVQIHHEANITTVQIYQKMPDNAELRFCIDEEIASVSYVLLYPYADHLTQAMRMELYRTARSEYELSVQRRTAITTTVLRFAARYLRSI